MSTDRRTRGSISSQHSDTNVHSTSVDGPRQLTRRSDEVYGSFDPMAETTQRIPYGYEDFTGGKINATVTLNSSRDQPSNHGEFSDRYGIGRDSLMSRDSQRITGKLVHPQGSTIMPQNVGMRELNNDGTQWAEVIHGLDLERRILPLHIMRNGGIKLTRGKMNSTVALNRGRNRLSQHGEFSDRYGIGQDSFMLLDSRRVSGRVGHSSSDSFLPNEVSRS